MKKLLLVLTLVVTTGLYFTASAKNKAEKNRNSGEKIFIEKADHTLTLIQEAAEKGSFKGVAFIAYIPGEVTTSWISKMKVIGNLTGDKNNFLGIVNGKAAEMASTLQNSGSHVREVYTGEFGWQGGLIKKVSSGYLLAAFSGGKTEQDLEAAKIGLDWLAKYF